MLVFCVGLASSMLSFDPEQAAANSNQLTDGFHLTKRTEVRQHGQHPGKAHRRKQKSRKVIPHTFDEGRQFGIEHFSIREAARYRLERTLMWCSIPSCMKRKHPISILKFQYIYMYTMVFTYDQTSLSKLCSFRQRVSRLAHLNQSAERLPPEGCKRWCSPSSVQSTNACANPAILQTLLLPLEPTTEMERAARLV